MPPPLPDRFRLEVRIDPDEDVEQWLGTDVALERPVLVRILGAGSPPGRREDFLRSVRTAATVNHPHIATVFTAGELPQAVYSVSEWTGGMTLADRVGLGVERIDPASLLVNASGLAGGLALLHASGAIHGAIDAEAILYTETQPAKLAAFGRRPRTERPADDVAALAGVISLALTGEASGVPPSEVVDGLDPALDDILAAAGRGDIDAARLAELLSTVPPPVPPPPLSRRGSRRLVASIGALVVLAAVLVVAGRVFLVEEGVAPPDLPSRSEPAVTLPPVRPPTAIGVLDIAVVDPFGDDEEGTSRLPNLVDGDLRTAWRTETYRDPLPLLKPGVGVGVRLVGSPGSMEILGASPGMLLTVAWDDTLPPNPGEWDVVTRTRLDGEAATVALPERDGGAWVLWIEELPPTGEGTFVGEIAEVRFHP